MEEKYMCINCKEFKNDSPMQLCKDCNVMIINVMGEYEARLRISKKMK